MTIFNKFFQITAKIQNNNRFFKYLSSNKIFMWVLLWIKWYLYHRTDNNKPAGKDFFKQNVARVSAILNKLADEKSKQIYTSIIEYRTTLRLKNYSLKLYDILPYFVKEVTLNEGEVFVDCGAYNGDTIDDFVQHCPSYKQIVAFEPGLANFEQLQAKYGNNPKMMLLNAGAWHKEEIVYFAGNDIFGTILAGGGGFIRVFPH